MSMSYILNDGWLICRSLVKEFAWFYFSFYTDRQWAEVHDWQWCSFIFARKFLFNILWFSWNSL